MRVGASCLYGDRLPSLRVYLVAVLSETEAAFDDGSGKSPARARRDTLVKAASATEKEPTAPTRKGRGPTPLRTERLVVQPTAAIAVPRQ